MCQREDEILRALRTGSWPEGLQAHLAECAACADSALVAGTLLEAEAAAPPEVPQGGLLYWKMQLRARRESADRATLPILYAEWAAAGLGLAGTVWALAWLKSQSETLALVGFAALLVVGAAAAGSLFMASRERHNRR